jgi:hypothetical protein
MTRSILCLLLGGLSLAGCAMEHGPQAQASAETRAACRQRAEQIYSQQNRGDIYRPPAAVNTPYSAGYMAGVSDRGLSDVFAHDRVVDDCVRNAGTGEQRSEVPVTPAPGAR